MKYYRLKEGIDGYPGIITGKVYPENHREKDSDTLREIVRKFHDEWEEVKTATTPLIDVRQMEEEREEILSRVNGKGYDTHGLANKILLQMIPSVMTVNGIVNHGNPLEEQAYDLAIKMNEERIKRGL